jgi:signal transduction histidine kinase
MIRFLAFCISFLLISFSSIAQNSFPPNLKKAIEFSKIDQYDSSEFYFLDQQNFLSTAHDTIRAEAFAYLHDVLWHNNLFDSAINTVSYAIEKLLQYDKNGLAAFAYRLRSLDFLINGKYDRSIEDVQAGIKLYQQLGDTLNWAGGLSALSNINHDIFEYDQGIKYGQEALALITNHSTGDPDRMAYALNCIAINYDDKGEYQKAIDHHMMVIEIMPQMKNERSKTRTFNNIGNSLMKLGRYDEAIGWLQEHEKLCMKFGSKYGLATSRTNLGTLSYLNKQYVQSKGYLDDAEKISYEIHDMEKIQDVVFQQYMLYKSWGKFDKSLAYMERFHSLKDSLLNENKTQQIAELQTKYETEKKEQQIALQSAEIAEQKAHNQRNYLIITSLLILLILLVVITFLIRSRERKKQALLKKEVEIILRQSQIEAALNSQESERKRFARDLHDGFGQMISVLNLNLKSLEKGQSTKEEVFENSTKVLEEMYKELKGICFNLMPETLIKQGVVSGLREFAARINNTGKLHVQIDTFGINERLTDLQEISIYRISQEWVNNILKYSNANRVTVSLTRDEEEITLLIEDNGAGFDKNLLINGTGNGWKNMNSRTNLLKGELELDTTAGIQGSTLIVNAPVTISKITAEI